jgi:hypothetical protein
MKTRLTALLFFLIYSFGYSQCPDPSGLFTTYITPGNALANWTPVIGADHYKIHYRIYGASTWLSLGNIGMVDSTRNLPLLQQSTTYEWGIMAFCDSTNQLGSNWSINDTFTTTAFVAAPFNPIITNTLSSLECNSQTELYLSIVQAANEPDIGTGTIISDNGYFNINSIGSGDSVGYAIMTTVTQVVTAVLKAGTILGQNYAVINSYDSTGSLIGLFTIENDNGGVKIEVLGSPNDGNNYTSGYVSELYLTSLFVNPQNAGPLHFFANINSELSDQIYTSDTVEVWCNTTEIRESVNPKKIIAIYDVLGRKDKIKINTVQFIKFSDGTMERRIFIKK